MSLEWSTLEEVADVIDSLHKTPTYSEFGLPMVRGTDVKYGELNLKQTFNVDEDTFSQFSRRYKPAFNDIIITRVGSYGITARVTKTEFCLGQNTSAIVPTEINPRYLYSALNSSLIWSQIESGVVGSTQKTLSLKVIKALKIPRHGENSETEIATILGALDDRITLLRETNATLEAIAQALFKSWFVDFDPVHAKMQGTQPEGMDEQTAALFPDSFEESELGLVPAGWEVGKIGDVSTVKGGFAYKGESFCDEGLPVIKIKNIVGDGTVNLRDVQYINSEVAEKTKRFALQDADVVIAMTGATIGKTGVVVTNESTPYLNQRVAKFEDNSAGQNNKWFVFVAFQNTFISDQVVNSASGSAQPNISTTGIESVRLIIPKDTKLLSVFNELVSPLFNSWISNHKQAQTLADLRDTLLPRLISGQLRLGDVEEIAA